MSRSSDDSFQINMDHADHEIIIRAGSQLIVLLMNTWFTLNVPNAR